MLRGNFSQRCPIDRGTLPIHRAALSTTSPHGFHYVLGECTTNFFLAEAYNLGKAADTITIFGMLSPMLLKSIRISHSGQQQERSMQDMDEPYENMQAQRNRRNPRDEHARNEQSTRSFF